jgi:hypothetical protein
LFAYKNKGAKLSLRNISGIFITFLVLSCTVPENNIVLEPVESVEIIKNQSTTAGSFEILEGQSVILSVKLAPEGIQGGVHWQSSSREIVGISNFNGPEIIVTGQYYGTTIITAMVRNINNEVYAQAECNITVIPRSFYKWSYIQDGWVDIEPYTTGIIGRIKETLVRTGGTKVTGDTTQKGFILEGPGLLTIGSVMPTSTNSPFDDDPVYDRYGLFNFLQGPSYNYHENNQEKSLPYPLWANRVQIIVDYKMLDTSPALLRIQVNNNTTESDNVSAINNWFVAELNENSPRSGTLTGIFDNTVSILVKTAGIENTVISGQTPLRDPKLNTVLSSSFVCLTVPDGKILIRSIQIESAD